MGNNLRFKKSVLKKQSTSLEDEETRAIAKGEAR